MRYQLHHIVYQSVSPAMMLVIEVLISVVGQSIVTAQQCLLNKDTIWLRDRPVFAPPDSGLDVTSCHQSLLQGIEYILSKVFTQFDQTLRR